jgi:hypothetical protein
MTEANRNVLDRHGGRTALPIGALTSSQAAAHACFAQAPPAMEKGLLLVRRFRFSRLASAGRKEDMILPEQTDSERELLARAAQYDLSLRSLRGATDEEVFGWRWNGRDLGPGFPNRSIALEWIARWLDEDTPSQGLHLQA